MSYGASFNTDEKIAYLFPGDDVLSPQYFDSVARRSLLEPEKKLMFAVLEDAISCFQRYLMAEDRRGRRLFREAEEWILEKDSGRIFSFENVCEVIGWDPNFIREGMLRWKERKMTPVAGARIYQFNPRLPAIKKPVSVFFRSDGFKKSVGS